MIPKITPIRKLCIFYVAIISTLLSACQPVESPEVTSTSSFTQATKVATAITSTSEVLVNPTNTAISSPTYIPSQTPTATIQPTPQPTDSPLKKLNEFSTEGSGLAVSHDGSLVAITNPDDIALYVLNLETQEVKREFIKNPDNTIGSVNLEFSPDSNFLAAGGLEQDIVIWNVTTGEIILTIPSPFQTVSRLSFSPDSQLLALSSNEGLGIYNVNTGVLIDTLPSTNITIYPTSKDDIHSLEPSQPAKWFVGGAVFVPNHSNLLAVTINNPYAEDINKVWLLYFWDMDSKELREILTGSAFGNAVIVSPKGQFLIAESGDELRGWDIQNEREFIVQHEEELVDVRPIALTDSGLLATLNKEGVVTISNLEGKILASLETDIFITDVKFTLDENLLIAGFCGESACPIEFWELTK